MEEQAIFLFDVELLLVLSSLVLLQCFTNSLEPPMTTLPITRVTLFKHGVGAFEREAAITGASSLELTFKQDDVSDVLKSLTVLDLDGGTIRSVAYDSTKPIEQMLAEVAINIPESESLRKLLPQLKGAAISVVTPGFAPLEGSLLGVDTYTEATEAGNRIVPMISLVTTTGEVHSFDLFRSSVVLKDERMKRDLEYYLHASLLSKKKEARSFVFQADGEGQRRIVINYVVNAPVWKATYRMLLDPQEKPFLQGWAVVDNVQDENWENVQLSLVAGLPVSFQHDLYTPRFIERPRVEVAETTGVLPPQMQPGIMYEKDEVTRGGAATPIMAKRMREPMGIQLADGFSAGSIARSNPVQVRERQLGELFEYHITHPVSIQRNQSALVPIVQQSFEGKSVLYYQKAARAQNPMRAVEFKNSTSLTLEGGPVTVFNEGSYAGEAMLETTMPTDLKLVPYAVELSVLITDNLQSTRGVVSSIVISRGVATLKTSQVRRITYTIQSKIAREETLYLEHPRYDYEAEIRDKSCLSETTEKSFRFKINLPAQKTTAFVVEEVSPVSDQVNLQQAATQQLVHLSNQNLLPASARKTLEQIIERQKQVQHLQARVQYFSQRETQCAEQQKRIRENLLSLTDRTSEKELRDRYVKSLSQQEDELESLQKERASANQLTEQIRQQIDKLLTDLNVDVN